MTTVDGSNSGGTRARRAAKQSSGGKPKPGTAGATAGSAPSSPSSGAPETPAAGAAGTSGGGRAARRGGALDPDTVVALEEERDFLLKSLDDLEREHDAGDVDDVDYVELRDDYTARAAASIRALDQHATVMAAKKGERSWMRVAGVLVVVVLIAGAIGWFVADSSGRRDPGGSVSGGIRSGSLAEIQKAKAFTGQAQQALSDGDSQQAVEYFQQAIGAYDAALAIDPNSAEALTYQGWLLHNLYLLFTNSGATERAEQFEQDALESINQALVIDPDYSDALVFRAVIALRQGRAEDALADLNALPPDGLPSEMAGLVDQARQQAQAAVDATTTTTTS